MRDQLVLAVVLGMPILILALVLAFNKIMRLASTIVCPNCEERFPSTDITVEGVKCVHCNWCLVALSDEHPKAETVEGMP